MANFTERDNLYGGDQCQKYLFLVDVQTYFVGTFFMVIFLFERHFQI